MSGSPAAGHASVIRRHDSAPFPQPTAPYYGMISQPYPAFPMESFQKELHRINMMQSMEMSASPKKLLRPS